MSTIFRVHADNTITQLSSGIDAVTTTINVKAGSKLPSTFDYVLTIYITDPNILNEKVLVTNRVGNVLTVTRDFESSGAKVWPEDANIGLFDIASDIGEVETAVNNIETGVTALDSLNITSAAPLIKMIESDQAANEKRWEVEVNTKTFRIRTENDADTSGINGIAITRGSGSNIDSIAFRTGSAPTGTLAYSIDSLQRSTFQDDSILTSNPLVHIEQLGSGDAQLHFSVVAQAWVMGIDNSDGDAFKLTPANDSFAAPAFTITPAKLMTLHGDLLVDGGNIGITADADLLALSSGLLTVNGDVTLTGDLLVDGTNIGITADADLLTLAANLLTVAGSIVATSIALTDNSSLIESSTGTTHATFPDLKISNTSVASHSFAAMSVYGDNETVHGTFLADGLGTTSTITGTGAGVGTWTNHGFTIFANKLPAISIDTALEVTFAGDVSVTGDTAVNGFFGFGTPDPITIASGAFVATGSYMIVTSESGTADFLDNVTGGGNGDQLMLIAANTHSITIRHEQSGAGEFRNAAGADIVISSDEVAVYMKAPDGNWSQFGATDF